MNRTSACVSSAWIINPAARAPDRHRRIILTLLAIAATAPPAFALAPGEDGVRVSIPISGIYDAAQAVVVDADGNLVMAGSEGGNNSVLASITPTGALNPNFGSGGISILDLSPALGDSLRALVRLSDGRMVGCGLFFSPGTATDFVTARFNSDGSLDTTFDGTGFAVTPFSLTGSGGLLFDQCNAVAVQADGMVVSAGFTAEEGPNHVALTRHTADGQLDTQFGTGGKIDVNASATSNGNSEARAVAVQPDGKVLVAGYAFGPGNAEFLIMRFNTDGSPDLTFGSAGITRTPVGAGEDMANAMVLQPDGRIVIAGSSIAADGRRDFALARYMSTGVLDTSFGTGGLVTTPVGPSDDIVYALTLMPWGRLVAAGSARISTGGSGTDLAFVSYNADGGVDRYFGDAGIRMINVSDFDDIIYGLVNDIDHEHFWAVGTTQPTSSQDFLAIELGLNDTIFRHGFDSNTAP